MPIKIKFNRMCMKLFDPCAICQLVNVIICGLLLFVIGGYVGKGIYLYSGKEDINALDVIRNREFFVPDGTFFMSGFIIIIVLFAVGALLRAIFLMLKKCVRYICCRMCCRCSCGDIEEGNEKRNNSREKSKNALYKGLINDDDDSDDSDDDDSDDKENASNSSGQKRKHTRSRSRSKKNKTEMKQVSTQ